MKKNRMLSLLAIVTSTTFAVGTRADGGVERSAKILQHHALPPFSLANLGYTEEQLALAGQNGLPSPEYPAPGSGIQRLGGNYYVGVSDRGPALARTTPSPGRIFPLPEFTPTILFFQARGGEIQPDAFIPLVVDDAGTPATGMPNSATEDAVPFPNAVATTPLAFNPNGLDIEDLYMFQNGGFIMVDEYSPSVVIVSEGGKVLKRYTPAGKTLSGTAYPVSDRLPAILSQRRANRGFESVAVTKDEQTAYVVMQSPLGPTSAGSPTRISRVLRILRLDIRDLLDVQVTGHFLMLMREAADYPEGNRPQDLKLSAAVWVAEEKLLVIERSDEPGKGGAKLVLIDLANATNLLGMSVADTLTPEEQSADLKGIGLRAADSTVLFDNKEIPELTDFKLEGLSILNRNDVAVSNDNDFGVEALNPFQLWIIRLKEQLPF